MNVQVQRPLLSAGTSEIARISNLVASNPVSREEFVANPVLFLSKQGVDISSSKFYCERTGDTSEACTALAVCIAAIYLIAGIVAVALEVAATITVAYGVIVVASEIEVIASVEDPLKVEGFSPTNSFVV